MNDRTPNRNIPQQSNSQSISSSGGPAGRPRKSSFIASLLGRSLSLSDDHYLYDDDEPSTNSDSAIDVSRIRSRSLSVGDESIADEIDGESGKKKFIKKKRSATMSLLGEHSVSTENNEVFISSSSNEPSGAESFISSRETSQTDHLNKKLLSSFLTRINTMATSFVDPSGTGENSGQVYTDDVVMDRIFKRVENNSSTNVDKN